MISNNEARSVRILSVIEMTDAQWAKIEGISDQLHLRVAPLSQMESLLEEVEILYTRHAGFTMDIAPQLRWVQLASASVDRLLGEPILNSDVRITNVSGIHAIPVAEYVFASMLAFIRRFPQIAQLRDKHWMWPEKDTDDPMQATQKWLDHLLGLELRGKTIGILGYGSIGREVARLAKAFGMRVVALKRSPEQLEQADTDYKMPDVGDPNGSIPERVVGPDRLEELLAECDFVVCCLPLTEETRGMIGTEAFAAMHDDTYFVNVGRGGVVDESAMIEALQAGIIAGVGLDVYESEPLPSDSLLYDLPNAILTPHIAPHTPAYDDRATDVFGKNLLRYLADEPLLNLVDKNLVY